MGHRSCGLLLLMIAVKNRRHWTRRVGHGLITTQNTATWLVHSEWPCQSRFPREDTWLEAVLRESTQKCGHVKRVMHCQGMSYQRQPFITQNAGSLLGSLSILGVHRDSKWWQVDMACEIHSQFYEGLIFSFTHVKVRVKPIRKSFIFPRTRVAIPGYQRVLLFWNQNMAVAIWRNEPDEWNSRLAHSRRSFGTDGDKESIRGPTILPFQLSPYRLLIVDKAGV